MKRVKPTFGILLIMVVATVIVATCLLANSIPDSVTTEVIGEIEALSEEELSWYERHKDQPGSYLYMMEDSYLAYYCADHIDYTYYGANAKLKDGMLILNLSTENAWNESMMSQDVLVRIGVDTNRVRYTGFLLDDTVIAFEQENAPDVYPEWLLDIYGYRTQYVGDNMAVSNINNAFYTMYDLKRDGIELQTEEEPYGLTLRYTSDLEAGEAYQNYEHLLHENGILFFSLVENLDQITITVNEEVVTTYGRENEDIPYGDLWEQSETFAGFVGLYDKIIGSQVTTAE